MAMRQIDIRSAYLYGKLKDDEVIHMSAPPGYKIRGMNEGQVIRLKLALYGLKQAGRRWYEVLIGILKNAGMIRSDYDDALFYRHHPNGYITILFSHVDDLSILSNEDSYVDHLIKLISQQVEYTGGGELKWLLGVEIERDRMSRQIKLRQSAYIRTILTRYGFQDVKPVTTPMDTHIQFTEEMAPTTDEQIEEMKKRPYAAAVGALRYLADMTRPDLAYAVGILAKFLRNPGFAHWTAVKRVFQYLQATKDYWLVLGSNEGKGLVGYTDSDGMSTEGRKPIAGYVFHFYGTVNWSSKRQTLVTRSTAEAEYIALSRTAHEAVWMSRLLSQLFKLELTPVTIYCDSQAAIALLSKIGFHQRTKHIDIHYHFTRQCIADGQLNVEYVPTDEQLADILTKALPAPKVKHFTERLGLCA